MSGKQTTESGGRFDSSTDLTLETYSCFRRRITLKFPYGLTST